MFKEGDIVVCIAVENWTNITKGKTYVVLNSLFDGTSFIINDLGYPCEYSTKRFISIQEYRNVLIDEILG